MSTRTRTWLEDDYDQELIEQDDACKATLTIDGDEWALDLRSRNVAALRELVGPFIANVEPTRRGKPRRKSRPTAVPSVAVESPVESETPGEAPAETTGDTIKETSATPTPTVADAAYKRELRAWGRKNGWSKLGTRGRIPDELTEAYAAHLASVAEHPANEPAAEPTSEPATEPKEG